MYLTVKYTHLILIVVSVCFFIIRFIWRQVHSRMMSYKWVRVTPHIIDSSLLLSGVALIYITSFMPFTASGEWLTEKLFCVIAYIGLGYIALRPSGGTLFRVFAFGGALGWLYLAASLRRPALGCGFTYLLDAFQRAPVQVMTDGRKGR